MAIAAEEVVAAGSAGSGGATAAAKAPKIRTSSSKLTPVEKPESNTGTKPKRRVAAGVRASNARARNAPKIEAAKTEGFRARQSIVEEGRARRAQEKEAKQLSEEADKTFAQRNEAYLKREAENDLRTRRRIATGTKAVFGPHDRASLPAASDPFVNPVLLVIFVGFGVIVIYTLLTHPTGTAGFLDSMRGWIQTIYDVKPAFTLTQPSQSTGGGAGGGF